MQKLGLILVLLLSYTFLQAQTAEKKEGSEITFSEKKHEFGDIVEGSSVSYTFKFKNTGNQPLVVNNVLTQCGCTAPEWPQDPIAPGKSGEIKIKFNSTGKMGMQNKTATVMSNAINPMEQLVIVTNVLP
ncbi:MAG: DUF1573 domain-containing protein, partial [Cytophagales bacterium]|nr:DUF1573 domain-containing protein [Cytophagales bacterium]